MKLKYQVVAIRRALELVGQGTNLLPFAQNDTPARLGMFNNHLSQGCSMYRPSRRKITTLVERDWANYAFGKVVEHPSTVVAVIQKYPRIVHQYAPKENPYSIVILETMVEDGGRCRQVFDYIQTDKFGQHHPVIGYKYNYSNCNINLAPNVDIPAGTVLARTKSVDKYGNYNPGREVNIAYMSDTGVTEDGFIISESLAKSLGITTFEARDCEWGRKVVPLNIYGYILNPETRKILLTAYQITSGEYRCTTTGRDVFELRHVKGEVVEIATGNVVVSQEDYDAGYEIIYRPYPGIGDPVRPDGLLFATREINERSTIVDLTSSALMRLCEQWDRPTYAPAGAKVVDIDVYKGDVKATEATLCGMSDLTDFYHEAHQKFYSDIVDEYNKLRRRFGDSLAITARFSKLVRHAMAIVPSKRPKTTEKVIFVHKGAKFDHWRVTIKVEAFREAKIGFKPSDYHGGKGVICAIWRDEDMPVTDQGVRADLVMDWLSIIKRMNLGQMYEHQINAHSHQQVERVKAWYSAGNWQAAWESMILYYSCVSTGMVDVLKERYTTDALKMNHIKCIVEGSLEDGEFNKGEGQIYIWAPVDNPIKASDQVRNLTKHFPLVTSPVTFRGRNSGKMRRSKMDVIVSSKYMIILEKIPDGLTAISGSKLQAHGLPATISRMDKRGYPIKRQAGKVISETEGRLYGCTIGGEALAEYIDNTSNQRTAKAIFRTILTSEQPSNIERIVNRKEIPLGGSRPIQLWQSSYQSMGIKAVYEDASR